MDYNKEVERVLSELKSAGAGRVNCSSSLYGALIMMRTTLIKSKEALVQLVKAGCVPMLLDLLIPPTEKGSWLKTVDIVISILANMCLEEEAREQVISSNGLFIIVEATECTSKESINNRGVRAVANLVQYCTQRGEICDQVFELEFPAFVAKRLMETGEKECKLTYLRAIRLLGHESRHLTKLIEDSRSVQAVASVLKDEDQKLKQKSLRILHEFSTVRCCPNFVEQILAANILEELVQAVEDSDEEISSLALSLVLKLCDHESMRPPLGAAGLIATLMNLLDCQKRQVDRISLMNALCLCSGEAVNRHRLYQEKTLELFMSALSFEDEKTHEGGKFSVLHDRIISCIVSFIHNDECFEKLLELGLVPIIISHLRRVCDFEVGDEDWSKEIKRILDHRDSGVDELNVEENDDGGANEMLEGTDNNISDVKIDENPSLSSDVDIVEAEEDRDIMLENTQAASSADHVTPSDHLDQEVIDISMEDTEVIPPSGTTADSRHIFSIDSPTYQMEQQHSWRIEDHTHGVTCKNYSENHLQSEDNNNLNARSLTEERTGIFSPYSPLSTGASYYSPAYPSPVHSFSSSPRHSNFQTTSSFNLGSQSPLSSPAWSSPSSQHLDDDHWDGSSSDHSGRSPNNPTVSHHGQYSPLLNRYTSPPPFLLADGSRDVSDIPVNISLTSSTRNKALDITQPESPGVCSQIEASLPNTSNTTLSAFMKFLKGENENPVYSASEEEEEEEEGEEDEEEGEVSISIDKSIEQGEQKTAIECQKSNIEKEEVKEFDQNSTKGKCSEIKDGNKVEISGAQPSTSNVESSQLQIIVDENATFPHSFSPSAAATPLLRLNSDPCFSSLSQKDDSPLEKWEQPKLVVGRGTIANIQLPNKAKRLKDDYFSSHLSFEGSNKKTENRPFSKQFSFPGRSNVSSTLNKTNSSQLSPFPSMSPSAGSFRMFSNSPSMSPFSRCSISPCASPNPHHAKPKDETCSNRSLQQHSLSLSISSKKDAMLHGSDNVDNQPSTSESTKCKDRSERLKKIKHKSEGNILVLVASISFKRNPGPYLAKYSVLSALTKYIGVVPAPSERCMRTLIRVFHNPLCFESVLLEQAPALVVRNLILNQDGTFPSVMFKDRQNLKDSNHINNEMNFDELFASSQSSETSSDFGIKIQFEFGGDAYSHLNHGLHLSSGHFDPRLFFRGKTIREAYCPRDSPYFYASMTADEIIRIRIHRGINLMKALTTLALSRYGDGEIQRIWARGTESEKLMCAISLLHMPIGCGRLHRHQFIFKQDALQRVIPILFCEESPIVRESIVTALSLLAHLFGTSKATPKISSVNSPSESKPSCSSSSSKAESKIGDSDRSVQISTNKDIHQGENSETNRIYCIYEHVSDKHNLNLIVEDDSSGERAVIGACKEMLMKKSDVFCAMLGGSYVEADKVDIELPGVNVSGCKYIMHYLHGCEPGCAVIDSLSLVEFESNDIIVTDCDNNKDRISNFENSCDDLQIQSMEQLVQKDSSLPEESFQDCDCSVKNVSFEKPQDMSSQILNPIEKSKHLSENEEMPSNYSSSTTNLNQNEIESNMANNNKPSTSTSTATSTTATSDENDNDNDKHDRHARRINIILNKCVNILTVADRFLLHDLVKYITSVLAHTCLFTSTSQDILYLACAYKLSDLVSDCVLEILLSHTPQKNKATLFLCLGSDSEIKEVVLNTLNNLLTKSESS